MASQGQDNRIMEDCGSLAGSRSLREQQELGDHSIKLNDGMQFEGVSDISDFD